MKRTKHIDLALMRKKSVRNKPASIAIKSLAIGVAASSLSACDGGEEVEVVTSILDCVDDTVMSVEQCRTAYQNALEESERIGPKYRSEDVCESEFGNGQCQQNNIGSFTPIMVGYLFANSLWDDNNRRYGASYNPVYRYFRPFSSLHNKLVTADGELIGEDEDGKYKMKRKSLKRKPSVSKTVSRGGFGSVARTKSSRSSWGG